VEVTVVVRMNPSSEIAVAAAAIVAVAVGAV
jgi:hypothetical protein